MFGLKKKGPSRPTEVFAHAVGCTIVTADPGFQPEWQGIEEGHWRRICQCWSEDIYEPRVDPRTRLDPLDPATFRHGGACEHRTRPIPPSSRPSCGFMTVRTTGWCNAAAATTAGRFRTTPRPPIERWRPD
jgi:hypothetical protein